MGNSCKFVIADRLLQATKETPELIFGTIEAPAWIEKVLYSMELWI